MTTALPNIILVVFDTARRDRFGCYGYERPTTPTVDSLAAEGMRVETMIASGPYTLPSHGSLFTGLYPTQHGLQWRSGPTRLPASATTMAEWLRGRGYHTVCATNNGLLSARSGLTRGFEHYASRLDLEEGRLRLARRARKVLLGGDSGGLIVNGWLRHELPRVARPLFLFVNYVECHWCYAPPPRLERRVGGPRFRPLEGLRYRIEIADRVGPWEAIARADDRVLRIYSTLYDAELANADAHLDALLAILGESGHLPEGQSIVLVTSDHGEHIGEHGLADHHASLDDLILLVPFVAWGPEVVPPGVQERLHEFVDVFPSLARLLGHDLELPYLRGRRTGLFDPRPRAGEPEYGFAEWRCWGPTERSRLARRNPSYDFSPLIRDLLCVRDQRYKLVRSSTTGDALYDTDADPTEVLDVGRDRPKDLARLRSVLDAEIQRWGGWETEQTPLSEEDVHELEQRLSELGYI
jgi:arylsulfatase A-like enzyme